MVLTVSFALSPVIGLVCHRHQRNCFRQLDAGVEASGPHDFAVRTRALSSLAPPASTASHPASVTIAIRPSGGRDGDGYRFDLGESGRGIFLEMRLDRANQIDRVQQFGTKTPPIGPPHDLPCPYRARRSLEHLARRFRP
jgi:hypothetical protein